MADGKIKLPRSSYEELIKIIQGYSVHDKPASLSEMVQATGLKETRISANNAFLIGVGLLEPGQSKKATSLGKELGKAINHNMLEEIQTLWSKTINENEFLSKMISAITIRNGMEPASLESHIAYSAGEAKAGYVETGARAVIEILKASGMVKLEDNKIIPVQKEKIDKAVENVTAKVDSSRSTKIVTEVVGIDGEPLIKSTTHGGVNINIDIRINASVEEMDQLTIKLRNLLDSFNKDQEK